MNDYYVYCHTSPSNKKYVGISCNPEKRWNAGKGYSKNYRFYRAIKKYGWDSFRHEIIARDLSIEEAKEMEKMLIEKWKLTDFKHGYNLREGGDGSPSLESRAMMSASRMGNKNRAGQKRTPEEKRKISDSLKIYYSTHENPNKGKAISEELRQKLMSRQVSEEAKRKMKENHYDCSGAKNPSSRSIRKLTKDGEFVCEYAYASLAADEMNIDLSSIIKCCRGKAKTCGGYRWEYK